MLDLMRELLLAKVLKSTTKRVAIHKATVQLNNRATAENVIEYIKVNQPNISVSTVNKELDSLVKNRLLKKVKTEKDTMSYDAVLSDHNYLYAARYDCIEDDEVEKLNTLVNRYFKKNKIKYLKVHHARLLITGTFNNHYK
jgi:Fur family peroxide stress response transcriptional regulator